jgi:hypothetical protein
MKPELILSELKIASFTADEFVKIKISLNNQERCLNRLMFIEKHLEQFYRTELSQLKQAQEVLTAAMRRDP